MLLKGRLLTVIIIVYYSCVLLVIYLHVLNDENKSNIIT